MGMTAKSGEQARKLRLYRIKRAIPHINAARALGITQVRALSDYLNEHKVHAPKTATWTKSIVQRALSTIANMQSKP